MTEPTPAEQAPARQFARLTDAGKVALTAGADSWSTVAMPPIGVESVRLGDGPHGVRRPHEGSALSMFDSHPATCFPTAAALGSTWDARLVEEVGVALGVEAVSHDIGVLLGPGVNLKRTPVGGRNFEYFAEDPLLTSRLGAAWVRGVQSTGVGASVKHFAANNTEQRRYGIDAVVDERALRELYLSCFERIVVDERPATVMAAYNKLNGEHCTENSWLLGEVLRGEWGFDGVVVSDWGASWDRTLSIAAGTDLTMPGLGRRDDRYVLDALAAGTLPRASLDAAARRMLELAHRYGSRGRSRFAGGPSAPGAPALPAVPDLEAHHDLARRAAAAGTVLLSNDGVLPLAPDARVALIGAMAREPRFQGAGSSHVVPTRVDTLLGALRAAVGPGRLVYTDGYGRGGNHSSRAQLADARSAAASADVAIVVVGLPETFETEGVDRTHLRLPPAHDRLVEAVMAANPRTVVVLQNGSPVELPWRRSVAAIVEGYLGGQAGGSAMAAVLTGAAEPGGRLAETFFERYAEHPVAAFSDGPVTSEYRESLYVGYRYADSVGLEVAFPFGHGLSYTRFAWSDARVERSSGDDSFTVSVSVTNEGGRRGSEVVQLYVHDEESSVFRPEQELRGFAKVELDAGETARVSIGLDARAFSFWSTEAGGWAVEPGRFELRLARSSRDVLWRGEVEIGGPALPASTADGEPIAYRTPSPGRGFPVADFERILGRPVPTNRAAPPGRFTLDTSVRDMQGTLLGRLLFRFISSQALKTIGAPSGAGVADATGEVVSQFTPRMFPTISAAVVGRSGAVRMLRLLNRVRLPRLARLSRLLARLSAPLLRLSRALTISNRRL